MSARLWMRRVLVAIALSAGLVAGCKSAGAKALKELERSDPNVTLEFEGNRNYDRKDLLAAVADELEELAPDGLSGPDVDDLAYLLELYYRRCGFPDAYVRYRIKGEDGGGRRVTFEIDEGRRAQIERFRIDDNRDDGDDALKSEALEAFFAPPGRKLVTKETWWYVAAELESGVGALESHYLAKGYLSAHVDPPAVEWLDEERTRAAVVIHVDQGPRWTLGRTSVEAVGSMTAARLSALQQMAEAGRTTPEGKPAAYTQRLAFSIRAKLLDELAKNGHPDAKIEFEEAELEPGRMGVSFRVDQGPRVVIGTIRFEGNEKTRKGVLAGRMRMRAGEVYDSRKVRESFERLFATGLFRTVEIARDHLSERTEEPDAEEVVRDYVVSVEEQPSLELTVEPGYGSYETFRLKLGVEDRNVLGTGRDGQLEGTVGPKAQRASIGIGDRSLFDSEYGANLSLFFDRREEPSFTREERGVGLDFSRSWPSDHVDATLGYRFRLTTVSDVDVVDDLVEEALADVDIASIALTVARDTRDRFFAPTNGTYNRVRFEVASAALGSELDFVKGTFETSGFVQLPWEGGIFAGGLETGVIAPIGGTDVLPLQVRFFNGGENTVRSFRENELGALDSTGEPLGGEAYTVISSELRQELTGPLSGALFWDVGNLEPNHEQYLDFDGIRQGLGVGLRWMLPIGPLRVDYAWNPNPQEFESDFVLHFAVGLSF